MDYGPPIRHCYSCQKELEELEGEFLPGQQVFDNISGIGYNTGQLYCKKCYKERIGENITQGDIEESKKIAKDKKENPEKYASSERKNMIKRLLYDANINMKGTKYRDFIKSLTNHFEHNGDLTDNQFEALKKFSRIRT